MAERLTASLEDGTLERLRTLAGGERKVGAYLSAVTDWLWQYRDNIGEKALTDFAPVAIEWIPRVTMSPEEQEAAIRENEQIGLRIDEQMRLVEEERQAVKRLASVIQAMVDGRTEDAKALLTGAGEVAPQ